jgi:hypothetical protein
MQLKPALQDFGFMVALVVTECVLQYSLALSNLLQRPSIDLVEAASEAETVISSLRKTRQDDNVWQELYQDITKLAEKQNVLPSVKRTFTALDVRIQLGFSMIECVNKCARLLSNILPFTFPPYHFCFIGCKIVIGQVACKWHKNLKFSFGCKGGKF